MFLLKTCLVLTIIHLVVAQNILFQVAKISYKAISQKTVRKRPFSYLTTIDQHIFANAIQIRIETDYMNLYEGAVKNLRHLQILSLKNCGILEVPPKTFKNLPKLEALRLQDNSISAIENGVFNDLPIKELWLHRNDIQVITSGAFDNMPNLEEIRLSDNELTSWDSNWFSNTPKLTRLYFNRNYITELPARAFANIKTSHNINGTELVDTMIFLTNNSISLIHPSAFNGIDSLAELGLKKNRIREIDRYVFSQMKELHKLTLKRNYLLEIDKDAFKSMSEMMVLDLSRNFLKCVPYEVISVVKMVNVTANAKMECDCLLNLMEKLSEEKLENKIVGDECKFERRVRREGV